MTTIVTVTPATYWTTLNDATLADVEVQFATGQYGDIWLPGVTYVGLVTIKPQDQAKPSISSMEVNGHNIRVTGFDIAMVPTTQYGMAVYGSDVAIDGNEVHQSDNKTFASTAVWIRNAANVSVTNNHIHHVGDGVDSLNCSNVTIQGNTFDHYASNATFQSAVTTCLVDGNTFTNGIEQPDSSHPDHIQFAGIGGRSSKVQISNNVITRGLEGTPFQGPFIEATDGLKIVGNAMQGTALNAISVSDSTEVEIGDNFIQALSDVGARIIVRGTSTDVNIHGNAIPSLDVNGTQVPAISNYNDGTPNVNVMIAPDNTIIPDATSPTDLTAMNAWLGTTPPPVVVVVPPTIPDPLQAQVDQLTNQVKTLSAQVADLETANTTLTSQNKTLTATNGTLTTQVATDKTQITKLQTKITNALAALNAP